ncbi:hypothetical protein, partial [Mesorhizobium sp. WSM4884]|uniref:hypothetical protein n=1 Tax=Mesorhizobium sp. WSM4884 TaxID=3038542 RepID=UPI002417AB58
RSSLYAKPHDQQYGRPFFAELDAHNPTEGVAARRAPALSGTTDDAGDLREATPSDLPAISPSRVGLSHMSEDAEQILVSPSCLETFV